MYCQVSLGFCLGVYLNVLAFTLVAKVFWLILALASDQIYHVE